MTDAVERVRGAELRGGLPVPVAGVEAVVAGAITALGAGDWWVPGLRERAGAVLRDVPVDRIADGARPYKVAPATASPALRALYAVGLAMADRDAAALVHLGIGSAADGAFYEALNLAALHRPTVIFLVAVHPLGDGAPLARQTAASPAEVARALGLAVEVVDGKSVEAVHAAVAGARQARGPSLVQADL